MCPIGPPAGSSPTWKKGLDAKKVGFIIFLTASQQSVPFRRVIPGDGDFAGDGIDVAGFSAEIRFGVLISTRCGTAKTKDSSAA